MEREAQKPKNETKRKKPQLPGAGMTEQIFGLWSNREGQKTDIFRGKCWVIFGTQPDGERSGSIVHTFEVHEPDTVPTTVSFGPNDRQQRVSLCDGSVLRIEQNGTEFEARIIMR